MDIEIRVYIIFLINSLLENNYVLILLKINCTKLMLLNILKNKVHYLIKFT